MASGKWCKVKLTSTQIKDDLDPRRWACRRWGKSPIINSQHQGGRKHTLPKQLELKRPEDWDDWILSLVVGCALIHPRPCSKSTAEEISSTRTHSRKNWAGQTKGVKEGRTPGSDGVPFALHAVAEMQTSWPLESQQPESKKGSKTSSSAGEWQNSKELRKPNLHPCLGYEVDASGTEPRLSNRSGKKRQIWETGNP